MNTALYDIPLKRIDGTPDRLREHAGKVLLIVNVASKCGLTPQYKGLEALFQNKRAQGLEVLGFPANNFLGQEPGSEEEIRSFCSTEYDVHFPLFSKTSVVGADQHPLYAKLIAAKPTATGDAPFRARLRDFKLTPNEPPDILWNFEKFVISRSGEVVARFAPDVTADDPRLLAVIDEELKRPAK